MDDGKANALSIGMFDALAAAFDQAEADEAVVVLRGREGRFSARFDLGVLGAGGKEAATLLSSGFELAHRLLSFPQPIVIACTGHAIAMGVFLLLTGDYRIGVAGADHTITPTRSPSGSPSPSGGRDLPGSASLRRTSSGPSAWPSATPPAPRSTPASSTPSSPRPTSSLPTSPPSTPDAPPEAAHAGAAVVRAGGAVEMLRQEGVGDFTARRVAGKAATSTPAVYDLFGDKSGLLREVFFKWSGCSGRLWAGCGPPPTPGSTWCGWREPSARSSGTTRCWPT